MQKKRILSLFFTWIAVLLIFISGGKEVPAASLDEYGVYVNSGYLALRRGMTYEDKNEIGQLTNKDTVIILKKNTGNEDYWYVSSPRLERKGYVNCNYLKPLREVHVDSGYLALRSARSYNTSNEIGELNTMDTVYMLEDSTENTEYCYVYAPTLDKKGYVNKKYIGEIYGVKVNSGYLALRSEKSYKESNEIGELYSGETVTVMNQDTGNADYWYVYAPSQDKMGYVNCKYLIRTKIKE